VDILLSKMSQAARRFDKVELLIIYLDGLVFGEHHVI
jgi:hypothetical protein